MVKQTKERRSAWYSIALLAIIVFVVIMFWHLPAKTRQGVNFKVRTVQIPLAIKAMDFLVRDWKYRVAAAEIVNMKATPDERILAIYAWTREHIRRQPRDFPVIDDHILHIMIRGYGISDQMADVFTTLCAYAGVSAYWRPVRVRPDKGALVLSFALADNGWTVLDVANGLVFRDTAGSLVPASALLENPELISQVTGDRYLEDVPYTAYLAAIGDVTPPSPLRAELQMPVRRLLYELKRLISFNRAPA